MATVGSYPKEDKKAIEDLEQLAEAFIARRSYTGQWLDYSVEIAKDGCASIQRYSIRHGRSIDLAVFDGHTLTLHIEAFCPYPVTLAILTHTQPPFVLVIQRSDRRYSSLPFCGCMFPVGHPLNVDNTGYANEITRDEWRHVLVKGLKGRTTTHDLITYLALLKWQGVTFSREDMSFLWKKVQNALKRRPFYMMKGLIEALLPYSKYLTDFQQSIKAAVANEGEKRGFICDTTIAALRRMGLTRLADSAFKCSEEYGKQEDRKRALPERAIAALIKRRPFQEDAYSVERNETGFSLKYDGSLVAMHSRGVLTVSPDNDEVDEDVFEPLASSLFPREEQYSVFLQPDGFSFMTQVVHPYPLSIQISKKRILNTFDPSPYYDLILYSTASGELLHMLSVLRKHSAGIPPVLARKLTKGDDPKVLRSFSQIGNIETYFKYLDAVLVLLKDNIARFLPQIVRQGREKIADEDRSDILNRILDIMKRSTFPPELIEEVTEKLIMSKLSRQ